MPCICFLHVQEEKSLYPSRVGGGGGGTGVTVFVCLCVFMSFVLCVMVRINFTHYCLADTIIAEKAKPESKHPTSLVRKSTVGLLKVLSLCAGIHACRAQPEAIGALSGLMHSIVEAGCNYGLSESRVSLFLWQ